MKKAPTIERDGDIFVWARNALRVAFTEINRRTVSEFFPDSPYEEKKIWENTILGPPAGREDRGVGPMTSFEMQENGYVGVYAVQRRHKPNPA